MIPVFDAPQQGWPAWLQEVAADLRSRVLAAGAALVRGLPLTGPADIALARDALGIRPFRPTERFGQRQEGESGVVSPIRWPAERELCPYQEEAFSTVVPAVVLTGCVRPPASGGEALLSDARQIARHLPPEIAARVRAQGWRMARVFYPRFGMSWQDAFDCQDREQLAALFARQEIAHEWLADDTLRTWRRRPGFLTHPVTGEECWFNQLAFLNRGSLEPRERALLTMAFGDDLPVDTALGDGQPLSEPDLLAIQTAYDDTTTRLAWQAGDLLVTDNILTAQGRRPFAGAAEHWSAFGDPIPYDPLEKARTGP